MLYIKFLESKITDIDSWKYEDLKKLKILNEEEVRYILDGVLMDCHSQEDVLNVCITALHLISTKPKIRRYIELLR